MKRCKICGFPLEEDKTGNFCEDCWITIGTGGSAHKMAEHAREKERRQQQQQEKLPNNCKNTNTR